MSRAAIVKFDGEATERVRPASSIHTTTGMRLIACLILAGILASCDSGSSEPLTVEQNDANSTSGPVGSGDIGDCTHELSSDITSPTQLVNTPNYCDYLLTEWIDIRSLLTVEPGTVIRAAPDARLNIEGGELRAVGTSDQRIVFEGLASVSGYWRGIDVDYARNVVMDYVDIRDAGQVCSTLWCPDVGVYIDNTRFSFTNSSVSNSYVHGMSIADDTQIDAFSNNRFYGNELSGLGIAIELIPHLDAASDYYGLERANGNPAVSVYSGSQESGGTFRWKALNAPYFIDSYLQIEGGILQIEPGSEIVFGSEAWMTVSGNGVLKSLGTATDPIIFRGSQARPGHWDGIRMSHTNFDTNILQHTTLSHSGNTESLVSAYAALLLDDVTITISNSTFSENAKWGIYCTEPDYISNASIIFNGGGNRFRNNGSGHLPSNCDIR